MHFQSDKEEDMEYKIKYIEYQNQIDDIVFEFSTKYELLATFLSSITVSN